MGHRHEIGEILLQVFVGQINSDQTEGKGSMKDHAMFDNKNDAYISIRGEGVMGVGDGNVVQRTFVKCGVSYVRCNSVIEMNKTIYDGSNYGRKPGENGWVPEHDPRKDDPDYQRYVELKKKFEGS